MGMYCVNNNHFVISLSFYVLYNACTAKNILESFPAKNSIHHNYGPIIDQTFIIRH